MNSTVPVTPYDNDSRVSNVIAMVAGTLAVGTLTTVARLYTRFAIVKKVGIDDCFAVLSLVRPHCFPPYLTLSYFFSGR